MTFLGRLGFILCLKNLRYFTILSVSRARLKGKQIWKSNVLGLIEEENLLQMNLINSALIMEQKDI